MNARTSMMVAYSDGSLFDEIKKAILENKEIRGRFTNELELEEFSEKKIIILLDYILTKFKNIGGRWFVNKIRGQKRNSSKWATREQVSLTVERAQAKAEQRLVSISNPTVDSMYKEATATFLDPNNSVEDEASSDEDEN
jgi:hypothetical protein